MINSRRVVGTEVTALTTTLKIKLGTYVRFFILYQRNPFKNKVAHISSRRDRGWEEGRQNQDCLQIRKNARFCWMRNASIIKDLKTILGFMGVGGCAFAIVSRRQNIRDGILRWNKKRKKKLKKSKNVNVNVNLKISEIILRKLK